MVMWKLVVTYHRTLPLRDGIGEEGPGGVRSVTFNYNLYSCTSVFNGDILRV